jgi:phosphoenolpyruvate carboxykinase (GTP)
MADYFGHWLEMAKVTSPDKLPKIFYVNWFRRDDDGRFLWPGFGENSRVLEWVFERCSGVADAVTTPIGLLPGRRSIDISGLGVTEEDMDKLLSVDVDAWKTEVGLIREHYAGLGERMPPELLEELDALEQRLSSL